MEYFLLFAITITIASFISILLSQAPTTENHFSALSMHPTPSNLQNLKILNKEKTISLDNKFTIEQIQMAS